MPWSGSPRPYSWPPTGTSGPERHFGSRWPAARPASGSGWRRNFSLPVLRSVFAGLLGAIMAVLMSGRAFGVYAQIGLRVLGAKSSILSSSLLKHDIQHRCQRIPMAAPRSCPLGVEAQPRNFDRRLHDGLAGMPLACMGAFCRWRIPRYRLHRDQARPPSTVRRRRFAICTSPASERASILRIMRPRWAFTVISLIPSS